MDAVALARWMGREVRSRRTALGLTQAQLAREAGVSERLVRSLEQGEAAGIGLDRLSAVLSALGAEIALSDAPAPRAPDQAAAAGYTALLEGAVASWLEGAGDGR